MLSGTVIFLSFKLSGEENNSRSKQASFSVSPTNVSEDWKLRTKIISELLM